MKILGIEGEFTNFAQGRIWGTIAAIVLAVGWSIRRRCRSDVCGVDGSAGGCRSRGALATMIVVTICISVPMMNDPAFVAYLATVGQ